MKVRVTLEIDIRDPAEWTTAFGTEGAAAIRRDIKSYIGNEIQHAGVFGDGEVTAEINWS